MNTRWGSIKINSGTPYYSILKCKNSYLSNKKHKHKYNLRFHSDFHAQLSKIICYASYFHNFHNFTIALPYCVGRVARVKTTLSFQTSLCNIAVLRSSGCKPVSREMVSMSVLDAHQIDGLVLDSTKSSH